MNHRARSWVSWTLLLSVLLLLQGCETAPTVLTEVEIREVLVPVRTPLPDDCFEQHDVSQQAEMPAEGSLTFKDYVIWADGLVVVTRRYQAQVDRCGTLNQGAFDPEVPIEEP